MYADDSTIPISEKNISDIQTKVQEDYLFCSIYHIYTIYVHCR
jgi:hypothetical protein